MEGYTDEALRSFMEFFFGRDPTETVAVEEWRNRVRENPCYPEHNPCWPLLDDPIQILADPNRWPDHVCVDMLRESCTRWATSTTLTTGRGVVEWKSVFPLVVGRASLGGSVRHCESQSDLAEVLGWLPFDGEAFAVLAVRLCMAQQTIDLFGMATPVDAEPADSILGQTFTFGPLETRITGRNPTDPAVVTLLHQARKFWAHLEGKPIGRGRPRGSAILDQLTVEQFLSACRDLVAEHNNNGRPRPTQYDMAAALAVSTATLRRYLRSRSLSWPPFEQF